MKHLPSWLPFHQEAKKGRDMIDELVTKPYEHVKREMVCALPDPHSRSQANAPTRKQVSHLRR